MKKRIVLVLLLLGCLSTSWTIVEAAEKQAMNQIVESVFMGHMNIQSQKFLIKFLQQENRAYHQQIKVACHKQVQQIQVI